MLADKPSRIGIEQRNAAFCYPAELAHGFFHSLIEMENVPDYIFLPHFKSIPLGNGNRSSQVCPLVQGETFYLQSTFRQRLSELKKEGVHILAPLLDLNQGLEKARKPLMETAQHMGVHLKEANQAFDMDYETVRATYFRLQQRAHDSHDFQEAKRAYLAQESPRWQ